MRHNFISVARYTDPFRLINELFPNYPGWEDLPVDARYELLRALDFEPLELYVIDHKTVLTVDMISGDVVEEDELREFVRKSIEWAREEASLA